MDAHRRFYAASGVLLMLVGVILLALIWMPWLWGWIELEYWVPLAIAILGVLIGIVAVRFGLPRLTIPAIVFSGTAYLMYWQHTSGRTASWSYLWTVIPGLAGLGLLVSGLFALQADEIRSGIALMALSAVLYTAFGSWLGGLNLLNPQWVFVLFGVVFVLLLRPMMRGA